MVEIIKFVRPERFFDPEDIEALSSALEIAWVRLRDSNSGLARPAYAHAMREVLAKRIIEQAKDGTRNPQKLADQAIRFVADNYRDAKHVSVTAL